MQNQTNTGRKLKILFGKGWGGEEEEVAVQRVMRVSPRRTNPMKCIFSLISAAASPRGAADQAQPELRTLCTPGNRSHSLALSRAP